MTSHFEAIFSDGLTEDVDDSAEDQVRCTTYQATADYDGSVWTAKVIDLPEGHAVHAQGATWADVERNTARCVVEALRAEPGTVALRLLPADAEAAAALEAVTAARVARAHAEQAERDAVRHAARVLTAKSWSTRDAGTALRLSKQRISQLAPRTDA